MAAYSILMTVFFYFLLLLFFVMLREKNKNMGALIWSGYLKPGQYKVTAKSPCGNYVILETKKGKFIGVEIYGRSLPEVGETFQWKVTKLRGYEREVIPVVEGEGLFPPDGTALPR